MISRSLASKSRSNRAGAISSVAASFGAESEASGTPAVRSSVTSRLATAGGAAAPAPAAREKTIYRTSARIAPPPREFPTRLVLTLVAVAVLIGGGYASWKHLQPWISAKRTAGAATSEPSKATGPSSSGGQEVAAPSTIEPAAPAPNGQRPAEHKKLNYSEQARIIELTSLATIYFREGGCEKALPTYQQVLEIDPNNPRAYSAVQKCYSEARKGVKPPPVPIPAPTMTPDTPPNP